MFIKKLLKSLCKTIYGPSKLSLMQLKKWLLDENNDDSVSTVILNNIVINYITFHRCVNKHEKIWKNIWKWLWQKAVCIVKDCQIGDDIYNQ